MRNARGGCCNKQSFPQLLAGASKPRLRLGFLRIQPSTHQLGGRLRLSDGGEKLNEDAGRRHVDD